MIICSTSFLNKNLTYAAGGQCGRNYQDETCTGKFASMTCKVDEEMSMTASSVFKNSVHSPPPFECRPKISDDDHTGYWDSTSNTIVDNVFSNRYGRIDLVGCCWFGRGILFTRGPCNFGKIDRYLGIKAASLGYLNFYDVSFCSSPDIVCNSQYSKDLRWAVGYFGALVCCVLVCALIKLVSDHAIRMD